jgi:hypothetical protein
MKEIEAYWQSVREMEARHHGKAKWLRREEKGQEGTKNMEWTSIIKTEFTSVLAKKKCATESPQEVTKYHSRLHIVTY